MDTPAEIRNRTNGYAVQLMVTVLVAGYGFTAVLALPAFQGLRIPILYLVPVVLLYGNVLAWMIARRGQDKVPARPFVIGAALTIGGAVFDIFATVTHSPELSLEGNLYARMLLDSGHGVSFVYAYGAIAQFLIVLLLCTSWAAFLRHRHTLLTLVWSTKPKSRGEFIKAAFGGEGLTWMEMSFSPKIYKRYYTYAMYHVVLCVAWLGIFAHLYRWWLGAEWFGIAPNVPDTIIFLPLLAVGIVSYLMWLVRGYTAGIHSTIAPQDAVSNDVSTKDGEFQV